MTDQSPIMTEPIKESGMEFGPYPVENFFHIEKSEIYINIQQGVKIAEFLLFRQVKSPQVLIIEAKTTAPRDFENYVCQVCEKFTNTLILFTAIYLDRHRAIVPISLQNISLEQVEFLFVLVVKNHQKEWLPPLQDKLKLSLRPLLKTWNRSEVLVMNQEIARYNKLIS
jgi:hypothetical protein